MEDANVALILKEIGERLRAFGTPPNPASQDFRGLKILKEDTL
jgi:hypothetical protein